MGIGCRSVKAAPEEYTNEQREIPLLVLHEELRDVR
jgi:hypothetical protein